MVKITMNANPCVVQGSDLESVWSTWLQAGYRRFCLWTPINFTSCLSVRTSHQEFVFKCW